MPKTRKTSSDVPRHDRFAQANIDAARLLLSCDIDRNNSCFRESVQDRVKQINQFEATAPLCSDPIWEEFISIRDELQLLNLRINEPRSNVGEVVTSDPISNNLSVVNVNPIVESLNSGQSVAPPTPNQNVSSPQPNSNSAPSPLIHHPEIQSAHSLHYPKVVADNAVEPFSGCPIEWNDWVIGFTDQVANNPNLPDSRKAYLLARSMPLEFRTVVKTYGVDWKNGLEAVRKESEDSTRIRQAIIEKLRKLPHVREKASIDEWRKFRAEVSEYARCAAPFWDLSETVKIYLVNRLPQDVYVQFVFDRKGKSLSDLMEFLKDLITSKSQVLCDFPAFSPRRDNDRNGRNLSVQSINFEARPSSPQGESFLPSNCIFCEKQHYRVNCPLSITERKDAIKRKNRCYGCFRPWENEHRCRYRCELCRRPENLLLCDKLVVKKSANHQDRFPEKYVNAASTICEQEVEVKEETSFENETYSDTDEISVNTINITSVNNAVAYLPTLQLRARSKSNLSSANIRVLLDSGSMGTFISSTVVAKIGAEIETVKSSIIKSFGNTTPFKLNKQAKLILESKEEPFRRIYIKALIMNKDMIDDPPVAPKRVQEEALLHGIKLSDGITGIDSKKIDLVIGQNYLVKLFPRHERRNINTLKGYRFVETILGWTFEGTLGDESTSILPEESTSLNLTKHEPEIKTEINSNHCVRQGLSTFLADPISNSNKHKPCEVSQKKRVLELTQKEEWLHISSYLYPTDILSRGTSLSFLNKKLLWFHRPSSDKILSLISNPICHHNEMNWIMAILKRIFFIPQPYRVVCDIEHKHSTYNACPGLPIELPEAQFPMDCLTTGYVAEIVEVVTCVPIPLDRRRPNNSHESLFMCKNCANRSEFITSGDTASLANISGLLNRSISEIEPIRIHRKPKDDQFIYRFSFPIWPDRYWYIWRQEYYSILMASGLNFRYFRDKIDQSTSFRHSPAREDVACSASSCESDSGDSGDRFAN